MKKLFAIIAALLVCSAAFADWRQQGYDSVADSVAKRREQNSISISVANQEMFQAAKTYYPTDYLLAGTWEALLTKAQMMDRGEASKDEYLAYVAETWRRYERDMTNRQAQEEARQAQLRQAAMIRGALQGGGRALQQANQTVSCNANQIGTSTYVNCQ